MLSTPYTLKKLISAISSQAQNLQKRFSEKLEQIVLQ